jgi:hypothetical protein
MENRRFRIFQEASGNDASASATRCRLAIDRSQPQRRSTISLEDRPVQPPGGSLKVNLPRELARASLPKLMTPPATSYKSFSVMGKPFDPAKPDEYVASFKIRKSS